MTDGAEQGGAGQVSVDILARAKALQEQAIAWRRDLHMHPELGYSEFRTAALVADHLERLGLEVVRGQGGTGVSALLSSGRPGPTIALRADMDALPIADAKSADYRSRHAGVAHLCGHDAHTAMLMGAAQLLAEPGMLPAGHVKFIFQPAEEGLFGARKMIEDGVLQNPKVDAIAGLHVNPALPTGKLSVARGIACAACDTLKIKIIGKGGHAAHPHLAVDSIAVAAQAVTALQQISSRQIDPLQPVVLTIGMIAGGVGETAIAPDVRMLGTLRTLSPALRETMPTRIEQVLRGVTEAFGASFELELIRGNPSIINDDGMLGTLERAVDAVLGEGRLAHVPPSMGGEDFSFYSFEVPAVFFRLGVSDGREETSHPLHHPQFDLDERALPQGIAALAGTALQYLSEHAPPDNTKGGN